MKIAAIQMNSTNQRRANLTRAEALLREAARRGAGMAVLPEHFGHMQAEGLPAPEPEPLRGPTVEWLSGLARELGLWIVGGSFAEQADEAGKVRNTCPVLAPDGSLAAHYRKIHLFDLERPGQPALMESRHVQPGERTVVVPTPPGGLGLSICYDLRFPELYRRLRGEGATLFAAPSAFTRQTGQAHWELLLRARAVENACYVIAAAQWGSHGGSRESFGQSMIIDPWGRIVARCPAGEGMALAEVSPHAVEAVRRALDSTKHGRLLEAPAPEAGS